jgi:membrane-bound lytic murein transglycosylase A
MARTGDFPMSEPLWRWQFGDGEGLLLDLAPASFGDLEGWASDDHAAALKAFRLSMENASVSSRIRARSAALGENPSREAARQFFEANFGIRRVIPQPEGAIVTGYFEPELAGSRERTDRFQVPVYALPDDLVLVTDENRPDGWPADHTGARMVDGALRPYYTRQEIELGALNGRGLELCYLGSAAEAFVMHVQGSGWVRLPDGSALRLGFSGKNGHPYTSIGKVLVARGELDVSKATLDALLAWIAADAQRGRRLMWENNSFIFFHIRAPGIDGPLAHGVPLTPGRSLAVDPRYHRLGLPVWVRAAGLVAPDGHAFNRLMIAQDTGSAIRGPVRGDIFWGSGREAGRIAGATKHACEFFVLIPN